jgi:hypothetical protein
MKLLFLLRDQGSDGKMLLLIDNCSSFLLHMMQSDSPADSNSISFDESKALAQALQEKMEALMLFSHEQERYLLERQKDQIVIEDLQQKLSQVVSIHILFGITFQL